MIEGIQITRCPKCGSTRLHGLYDGPSGRLTFRDVFSFGIIPYAIRRFRSRNEQHCWWECLSCGNKFPMD